MLGEGKGFFLARSERPSFRERYERNKKGRRENAAFIAFCPLKRRSVAAPQRMTMVVTDMGEITRFFLNAPSYSVLRSQFSFVTVTVMFV